MYKKVEFKSKDGLLITADYYKAKEHKGTLLLCHRSHCNRAEYRETAPKFVSIGYSCLAIDQRSGMKVFGETNETKNRAKEQGLSTGYLDAQPDVEAGIEYAFKKNGGRPIILLGSSYTAALALLLEDHPMVKAKILFSPGEHLKGINLQSQIKNLKTPIFATSSKSEIQGVTKLFKYMDKKKLKHFKPKTEGFHGSKILWESVKGFEEQWKEINRFLEQSL